MKELLKAVLFNFLLISIWITGKAQSDSTYSFIVAGHAYGAHSGTNIGLHPPLLEKLAAKADSTVMGIFLTGDIVNHSTMESWEQVANELEELNLQSFYVMGNHDENSIGQDIFHKKHGSSYYSFTDSCGTFIILNSTESDRSISSVQMDFLSNVLVNSESKRIFVFFHEIIWNSHEKYSEVRSNSRSRYAQIKDHSNFWDEVFPFLKSYHDKEFYLFAGDVGGNQDAIAAFYDKWDNVTLLASGMGEVEDENYLQVNVKQDTVEFVLIPLNEFVKMKTISWYNVPEKPIAVIGPVKIPAQQKNVRYFTEPVFNATYYSWTLDEGISGNSDSSFIDLNFNEKFSSGIISVSAVNDGFGESEPAVLEIQTDTLTSINNFKIYPEIFAFQNSEHISIKCNSKVEEICGLKIYNSGGRLVLMEKLELTPGLNSNIINKTLLPKDLVIIELITAGKKNIQKMVLY